MTTTAELTNYLERTFGRVVPSLWDYKPYSPKAPDALPTVASYAAILRTDIANGAIQLGGWLRTDDGRLIAAAVRAMSPPPIRPYEQLLVQALIDVAAEQTDRRRQGLALVGVGVAAVGIALTIRATQ